jgi:1-acyl-sn-glycerol-3-phosphate acyltransferase
MHRNFHSVKITTGIIDKDLPVLMICNHISWWDGIWALHVNQTLFKRKYYFMMLEEQLRKNWFLNYTGGYSLPEDLKGMIDSLEYTGELLSNSNNLVLLFPQGEIESLYKPEFNFKKGIERILQHKKNDVQIVFLVNLVDYHSNVKPTVYSYLGDFTGPHKIGIIQKEYNNFYKECLSKQIRIKF